MMTMLLITVKPSYGFGLRIMYPDGLWVYNLLEDRNPL
jgi:hypothetical protein